VPKWMTRRSTPDLIVIGMAVVVGFVVVTTTTAVIFAAISSEREVDAAALAGNVSELTSSLIALIVGYIGGRGAAEMESRKSLEKPPDDSQG